MVVAVVLKEAVIGSGGHGLVVSQLTRKKLVTNPAQNQQVIDMTQTTSMMTEDVKGTSGVMHQKPSLGTQALVAICSHLNMMIS